MEREELDKLQEENKKVFAERLYAREYICLNCCQTVRSVIPKGELSANHPCPNCGVKPKQIKD